MASCKHKSDVRFHSAGKSKIDRLEELNYLRQIKTIWKIAANRLEYYNNFFRIVSNWKGPHPNLLEIIKPKYIDKLLSDLVKNKQIGVLKIKAIIEFVALCGYRDEPKVDEDGKPSLLRTTAIHRAARSEYRRFSERKAIVRELFKIYDGFEVNYTDVKSGLTHFHIACKFGFNKVVKQFLAHGQDPNLVATNESVDPPLLIASKRGKVKLIKLLLKHKANPNLMDRNGSTLLHAICRKHDDADLKKMILEICDKKHQQVRVDARDKLDNTPLHVAVLYGKKNMATMLLRRGANPNSTDMEGSTPLHIICRIHDDADWVKMFFEINDGMEQTVDIDAQDEFGNTPLIIALANHHWKPAKFLLGRGADQNLFNEKGLTPLHLICNLDEESDDSVELLWKLCEVKRQLVQVNAQDNRGNTPLHLALRRKLRVTGQLLLRRGANPNVTNENGSTALHSIFENNLRGAVDQTVKTLFELCDDEYKPVQVNVQDKSGNTPLHLALECYHNEREAELLMRQGAYVTLANKEGLTPLHIICKRESVSFLRKFLRTAEEVNQSVQVDARDKWGNTALHLALQLNVDKEVPELLLRNNADPNLANVDGSTPLHIICERKDYYDSVESFFDVNNKLGRTVQIDVQDNGGNTPLHLALSCGDKKIMELLLRNGADPNLANEDGSTPLHIICERDKDDDLVELFFNVNNKLGRTVQIDARDNEGNTPLLVALSRRHEAMIEVLLRKGANPNLANEEGSTPLHIICTMRSINFMTMFININKQIDQTVQANAQDNEGNTPLHLAISWGDKKIMEMLLRNGADPNVANEEGSTTLHAICNRRHSFIFYCDLAKLFFKINDELNQPLSVDAKDKKGQTPLQWAVANFRSDTVDLLLSNGADLASFVFPAESHFDEICKYARLRGRLGYAVYILLLASDALATVERLEKGGYELDRSDALTIMKLFNKCGLLQESANLDEHWYDGERFAKNAKKIMVKPNLSLYDLVRSQPKQAAKLFTYQDYLKFARSIKSIYSLGGYRDNCALHLCEIMSRGFFRDWALDPFVDLVHYRLPLECCEMIIDPLTNQDLCNICLASIIKLQKDNKKNKTTNVIKCSNKRPVRARKAPKRLQL